MFTRLGSCHSLIDICTVRDSRYKTKTIELTDIVTYAFAEFDDGSHGFWAAGKAGWFEIHDPTVAFQHIFDMMNEAASIFYFMVDKLRRARKTNYTVKFVDQYAIKMFKEVSLRHRAIRERSFS